jgi:hypothetical protein
MADPTIHDLYVAMGGDPADTDPTMQEVLEAAVALSAGAGAITWRGGWLIGTAYSQGDGVTRSGVAYLALADNTGSQPPSANWQAMLVQGPQGIQGEPAATAAFVDPDTATAAQVAQALIDAGLMDAS